MKKKKWLVRNNTSQCEKKLAVVRLKRVKKNKVEET